MVLPKGYQFPDVSRYRTVCRWGDYSRAYPVSACKATEGETWIDPSFREWLRNCRAQGIFPIAYHFLKRHAPVINQVDNYLSALDGKPFGVMLDIETAGDSTNPTMAQADLWFTEVSRRLGRDRGSMIAYMPRWWWQAYGNGSRVLDDTILHNSHFSSNPDTSPFAGARVQIIQFSSTAPIAGLCSPGTGDQNIAIDMTVGELLGTLRGAPVPAPAPPKEKQMYYTIYWPVPPNLGMKVYVDGALVGGFPNTTELEEFCRPYDTAGYERKDVRFKEQDEWDRYMQGVRSTTGNVGAELAALEERLTEKIDNVDVSVAVDAAFAESVAEALKPHLQGVVDAELDKREISLRTEG